MYTIEPYYNWRNIYAAEEDSRSPFYGNEYSEFMFTDQIYDHVIHPQWDNIDSTTLFIKIVYANYDKGVCIIELMGEWNDCLHNDIMLLKRNIIDPMIYEGIDKFILIGENILNFHASDDCYYEEWFDDIEDGWICTLNFRTHVIEEFKYLGVDQYFLSGGDLDQFNWRTFHPLHLYSVIKKIVQHRFAPSYSVAQIETQCFER